MNEEIESAMLNDMCGLVGVLMKRGNLEAITVTHDEMSKVNEGCALLFEKIDNALQVTFSTREVAEAMEQNKSVTH